MTDVLDMKQCGYVVNYPGRTLTLEHEGAALLSVVLEVDPDDTDAVLVDLFKYENIPRDHVGCLLKTKTLEMSRAQHVTFVVVNVATFPLKFQIFPSGHRVTRLNQTCVLMPHRVYRFTCNLVSVSPKVNRYLLQLLTGQELFTKLYFSVQAPYGEVNMTRAHWSTASVFCQWAPEADPNDLFENEPCYPLITEEQDIEWDPHTRPGLPLSFYHETTLLLTETEKKRSGEDLNLQPLDQQSNALTSCATRLLLPHDVSLGTLDSKVCLRLDTVLLPCNHCSVNHTIRHFVEICPECHALVYGSYVLQRVASTFSPSEQTARAFSSPPLLSSPGQTRDIEVDKTRET